jgi:hypothetical protein
MSASLIAFLIFVGIFLFILGGCLFLASREKTHGNPYGSWSQMLGPQWNSRAMDVGEQLNKDIASGRRQARHAAQRASHASPSHHKKQTED